jgi:hypothetical protein
VGLLHDTGKGQREPTSLPLTSELTTGTCSTSPSFRPVVHVTVGAKSPVMKDFIDENLVLLAGGLNPSHCANEGLPFQEIH